MEPIIRPARPEDKSAVAQLVYLSSTSHMKRSLFDVMFGTSREETLALLERLFIAEPQCWHHYSCCHVAEVDGKVASTTHGYLEEESGVHIFRETFAQLKSWTLEEIVRLRTELSPFYRAKPTAIEGAWIVEYVATFPEYQHQGLMKSLFEQVLKRGKQKGCKTAQITFAIGNDEAQAAYERAGFRFHSERTDRTFEESYGAPGFRMFTKAL